MTAPAPDRVEPCGTCPGFIYRFKVCDVEFCQSFRDHQRMYHFASEQHQQRFLTYIRRRLREGMFSKQALAYRELGITEEQFDQLLAAAGFQFVWMPMLVKASDRRIADAMEFPANQHQW